MKNLHFSGIHRTLASSIHHTKNNIIQLQYPFILVGVICTPLWTSLC